MPKISFRKNSDSPQIKACNFSEIIACAAGPKANIDHLKKITDQVVMLDNMDSSAFAQFFKWVSDSITAGSMTAGVEGSMDSKLPPPPPEVQVVL
jgi:uncharacterized protein YegL